MKVTQTAKAEIGMRTLTEADQRLLWNWYNRLADWENDSVVRESSKQLPTMKDTYILKASDEFRIFFRLNRDEIEILDIATREAILATGCRESRA